MLSLLGVVVALGGTDEKQAVETVAASQPDNPALTENKLSSSEATQPGASDTDQEEQASSSLDGDPSALAAMMNFGELAGSFSDDAADAAGDEPDETSTTVEPSTTTQPPTTLPPTTASTAPPTTAPVTTASSEPEATNPTEASEAEVAAGAESTGDGPVEDLTAPVVTAATESESVADDGEVVDSAAEPSEGSAATVDTSTTTAPPAAAHPDGWVDAGHGVYVPPVLLEIRWCESRDDYQAANKYSSARGAYQFIRGSWADYGHRDRYGVAEAHLATNAQQDEAAVITWERSGTRPWNASKSCWG